MKLNNSLIAFDAYGRLADVVRFGEVVVLGEFIFESLAEFYFFGTSEAEGGVVLMSHQVVAFDFGVNTLQAKEQKENIEHCERGHYGHIAR